MNKIILATGSAILVAGIVLRIVFGQDAPQGATKELVTITAYMPDTAKAEYTKEGTSFSSQTKYVTFKSNAWFDARGNVLGLPKMPDGMVVLSVTRGSGGCADPAACATGAKYAPAVETDFPCACNSGSNCTVLDGSGKSVAAPLGITMNAGTFSGAGCIPKACIEVTGTTSWPKTCPGGG